MKTNNKIGPIDTLIIQRSMEQIGYRALKRQIEHHEFEFRMFGGKNGNILLTEESPFYIEFLCHKKSKSQLSHNVFSLIKQTPKQKIDECTTWAPTEHPAVVQVTAAFYNKKALVTALNTLHHHEKNNIIHTKKHPLTKKIS